MDAITLEDMADLLVNIGLDEGCDYDEETIQPVLDSLWADGGGAYVSPALICIMELLKTKISDEEFATLRHLVVQGMNDDEVAYEDGPAAVE